MKIDTGKEVEMVWAVLRGRDSIGLGSCVSVTQQWCRLDVEHAGADIRFFFVIHDVESLSEKLSK